MTDLRALIAELADELDHNRQCLLDDRRLTHPLANKARAVLAESDGPAVQSREPASVTTEPTQRQLFQLAAEFWPKGCEPTQAVAFARAVLARWSNRLGFPDSSPPFK